jgi:Siphovirus ReqiPepy6 Gp37-like protein
MDIIKFNNPTADTRMENAEIINGFTSKMWVERYDKAGEFKFVGPEAAGLREKLPVGSFVSHASSYDIMIVENHEINDDGTSPLITITGRGFETFFESRIVGSNKVLPVSNVVSDYILLSEYSWNQAVDLISDHILVEMLLNDAYAIPYVSVYSTVTKSSTQAERTVKRDTLYNVVMNLLAIDTLGIKVIRPGSWSTKNPNTSVVIHCGQDRTNNVVFSFENGEILTADYLWSNKKLRNAALVVGKYVEMVVEPDYEVGYDRRMMFISAPEIDQDFPGPPTGVDLDNVIAAMRQKGVDTLSSLNSIALTKAETKKNSLDYKYRQDYDIGDLVTVRGNYQEVATMRVTEFVETEDNTGESAYPTLAFD